ncbi:MAG: inverse autotransporter beta domain-containing protein [Candidatus Thiodubiliella endoseptemdiera]|uniref:Inverse autotransporter beta domain-containing protein n=1 Tax=Candidatus Thiodubiliella endoseptemdiera TaxID=2738886 RepID=A0A853F277_9GAMM|nr:inverse autotransporter beta domain-containing protein [Candidatus Thiodubiliella endoseptemdiera]
MRNALGGIDSNNANQFGKTLSTNVANQLKNKAISTTEGFINDKANEYANSIGSGRSEISIYGIDSQALDYSIKTIQPLTTLDKDSKNLTFFQGRLNSGENHGERRNTLNLGIGQRFLLENDKSIVGINLFTDYETKSKHKRLSLGLEYQRTNFKANINKYYPLTDKKVIGAFTEEVLPGYDVKLEGQAPYLPWAKIKGSRYYWDGQQGPDIKGTILGVEVKLTPSLELEIGTEKSNTAERASYARLTTQLPFKDNERFTDFSISDTPFKNEGIVHLTDLSPVERSNKIRIEKLLNGVSNGVSVVLGEYNATTVGARCVVYSASNVAIAGGSGVTDARGLVDLSSVVIPAGLVTMTCTGGSYTDEATGSTIPAPMFRAATIYSGTGELTLITSPLSEIAYRLATAAGNLAANIADQNTVVATAFGLSGINITNIIPTDLNNEVAGDSPKGKFGLVLAGISQMQESSPAVTIATLATDISDDGTLNDANQDLATAINRCATGGMGLGDGTACATGSGRTGSAATATGEGTIKGNLAIVKISNYDGTNVVPTLQDYIDAGVTGVTAGNLAAVNADIATATTTDSDTTAEIQVIVNTTVTAAAASSSVLEDIGTDANTASTSDTTIAEFGAILPALTGFVDANLTDYQTYIDANPGSFASHATRTEVQAMVTAVNVTVAAAAVASNSVLADIGTDANTASTSDTTIAEFGAILPALTGFVDANLADYQATLMPIQVVLPLLRLRQRYKQWLLR